MSKEYTIPHELVTFANILKFAQDNPGDDNDLFVLNGDPEFSFTRDTVKYVEVNGKMMPHGTPRRVIWKYNKKYGSGGKATSSGRKTSGSRRASSRLKLHIDKSFTL
ncbi:MAG: hypothetical protein HPY87_10265 [Fervidobacterium sp.]|uniref:hypothetical protein n=1 Tax=Fervidobacterium sp. TaxID=1871331 RepID=UPI0025C32FFA|nr:hypothetical protein [Fervidobacterium sp.]NPU90242.1 hypothetical protein [Fervidobacterium sp.]